MRVPRRKEGRKEEPLYGLGSLNRSEGTFAPIQHFPSTELKMIKLGTYA